ncbi:S-adenosylmethionine-dependent methyltransferase-like protein [Colletotrichum tofieldiae]|nr:S-adenosylmethionine-dependent methyltransferase-like protein [Colletotrichum tofieldiae]GKT73091.1 S-adenosylmethionine-dependent methyltransferase-like protein [Colletotrichum tofieldiae]
MPAFGRIGRHHNRSQQALVDPGGEVAGPAASHSTPAPPSGSAAAGPGAPSSSHSYPHSSLAPASGPPGPAPTPASNAITANAAGANNQITPHSASSTAFSSSESFDIHPNQLAHQHQHQQPQLQHLQQPQQGQQGPPPPPHEYPPTSTTAAAAAASRNSLLLQHHNPPIADLRQRSQQDFTDSVSRSQSQRYPPGVAPYPNNNQFNAAASSSVDNLRASVNNTSPAPVHSQATSPLPQPAPEKRSARRLLKNILGGSGRDHHNTPPPQPTPPSSYDNTAGLARRPSKRVSNLPSARTVVSQQSSQQSLDQQSADWPLPGPHQQPSPLQGVGEIEDRRLAQDPNRDPRLQNPEPNRNSVRYVPTDFDNTPYEEPVYGDQHPQQVPALQEQHQLGQQAVHDPSQQQYQQYSQQQSGQYQAGPPAIYTSHLGAGSHQNPETVSQLSHESPVTDSDARSANVQSTQTSPAVRYAVQTTDSPQPPTLPPTQQGTPQPQQQHMAPPSGGPPPNRRSQETEKALRSQVDAPSGPPPGYRQSQTMPPSAGGATAAFRPGGAQEARQFEGATGEQGRNSPQPSNPDRDGTDPDKFKELCKVYAGIALAYKNVKRLYFDGKTQIDSLNSQIEQLQNAVANQRISQSRTALDDSEYITRFNRLNGAINNLSFNIRKDWRTVPQWLDMFVSIDALKTGKQEMTAVGRAVITRWIVEEIFNKCFHPGLNFELSRHLKEIELNIRRFSYTMTSQEEFDALTNKVVSWRMATLEGLQRVLNSPESADNRADFTRMCTSNLTATLFQYMTDPPPAGVDGSASMIVELAVGIAANLPLESRDVAINYPLPGDPVQLNIMEVEKTPLPPLDIPKPEGEAEGDDGDKDKNGKTQRAEKTKSGMFTTMLGGGPHAGRKGSTASSVVPTSTDATPPSALPPKDSNTVRLAGFPAVEVRGRQVLVKATVWTI